MSEWIPTWPDERIGHDLAARAAVVARRAADVIEARCSPESGAPTTVRFLRDWAGSTSPPSPPVPFAPLDELALRVGMSDVEVMLVLLAGLSEEHEGLAASLRACHPESRPHPTVGLAALVLEAELPDRSALRRLLVEGAAMRAGVLTVRGDAPFYERSLRLGSEVWDALHGHDAWPEAVPRVALGDEPPGLDGWSSLPAVVEAAAALQSVTASTLVLPSAERTVAAARAMALTRAAGLEPAAAVASGAAAMRLHAVHAAIRGAVPVVFVDAPADGSPVADLDLDAVPSSVVVCADPGSFRPSPRRPLLSVPLGPVSVADRRAAWRAALPDAPDEAPALAARHPLDPAVTAQVALDVAARAEHGAVPVDRSEVAAVIRARAGAALPAGVDLVTPRAQRERPVLDPEQAGQLRDAVARLEHQSLVLEDWDLLTAARADRGVRLLFTGPPGTGKTLAAETLAVDVGTDLLLADSSRLMSKWIGETEKNLASVFEVAERTQAVLLLDEADALFATRTGIADAHDRYANLETAYLLQRLDRFDGLAVLATNLRQNIDPAFLRRMDYVVEFPLPDLPARLRLWEQHLPGRLLAAEVDVVALAEAFEVPGSWIRNAAIEAAYLAAAVGGPVRAHHIEIALEREYRKANRPMPDAVFHQPPDRDEAAARLLLGQARVGTTQQEET